MLAAVVRPLENGLPLFLPDRRLSDVIRVLLMRKISAGCHIPPVSGGIYAAEK